MAKKISEITNVESTAFSSSDLIEGEESGGTSFRSTYGVLLSSVISDSRAYNLALLSGPAGNVHNGMFQVTVAANAITVALKTLAGADPSATAPVAVRIGNVVYTVTAALSITKNAGTNWFNSGSAELATKEVDYFVYLGRNATDGVTLGFARIPYATSYGDFNTTSTNERYAAISTITNAAGDDPYVVIGRFAAILSASASYNWSIPSLTNVNVIQRPIFETRRLTWVPTFVGYTGAVTITTATYQIVGRMLKISISFSGTSNATNLTYTVPMLSTIVCYYIVRGIDNSAGVAALMGVDGTLTVKCYKDAVGNVWTNSGVKQIDSAQVEYPIS